MLLCSFPSDPFNLFSITGFFFYPLTSQVFSPQFSVSYSVSCLLSDVFYTFVSSVSFLILSLRFYPSDLPDLVCMNPSLSYLSPSLSFFSFSAHILNLWISTFPSYVCMGWIVLGSNTILINNVQETGCF